MMLPEPVSFADSGVTAYRIILISNPHNKNYVESGCRVIKELGHYRLHTCNIKVYIAIQV